MLLLYFMRVQQAVANDVALVFLNSIVLGVSYFFSGVCALEFD